MIIGLNIGNVKHTDQIQNSTDGSVDRVQIRLVTASPGWLETGKPEMTGVAKAIITYVEIDLLQTEARWGRGVVVN